MLYFIVKGGKFFNCTKYIEAVYSVNVLITYFCEKLIIEEEIVLDLLFNSPFLSISTVVYFHRGVF